MNVRESISRECEREREPAAASQGLFTSAGGLFEILFPLLYLDIYQLAHCTSHSGRVDSHQQSHHWPPKLERISVIRRELVVETALSTHLQPFYTFTQPAACLQINKQVEMLPAKPPFHAAFMPSRTWRWGSAPRRRSDLEKGKGRYRRCQ